MCWCCRGGSGRVPMSPEQQCRGGRWCRGALGRLSAPALLCSALRAPGGLWVAEPRGAGLSPARSSSHGARGQGWPGAHSPASDTLRRGQSERGAGVGHGEHCTLALDGSQNTHGFQGCPRLRVFSQPSRKISSGLYWVSLEPLPFAPPAGGFCCRMAPGPQMGALHLAVGAGCCCCHGNGREWCVCFSWVGMGWGRRESCEDSLHIQGAVHSWPPLLSAPLTKPHILSLHTVHPFLPSML